MTERDSQSELERQVRESYPLEEVELRLLFNEAKRNAVALFKNDHDDGDTAIYQFISDIIPEINTYVTTRVKEVEQLARIDELSALDKSEIANQSMKKMQIRIKGRLEVLTTTTNGEGETDE